MYIFFRHIFIIFTFQTPSPCAISETACPAGVLRGGRSFLFFNYYSCVIIFPFYKQIDECIFFIFHNYFNFQSAIRFSFATQVH